MKRNFVAGQSSCFWCGIPLRADNVSVDHIIPISRGGSRYAHNLCLACKPCNSRKGDQLPSEILNVLKPTNPGGFTLQVPAAGETVALF